MPTITLHLTSGRTIEFATAEDKLVGFHAEAARAWANPQQGGALQLDGGTRTVNWAHVTDYTVS